MKNKNCSLKKLCVDENCKMLNDDDDGRWKMEDGLSSLYFVSVSLLP